MSNSAFKILVVEYNDELREATLQFLQSQGHYVRGVPMAEDINDVTGGFVPDIYIIDLILPDEDGLSLTRRLRQTHPFAGIVIATARAQIGDRVLGYESGADLYLTKPVDPRELMAGIAALGNRLHPKVHTSDQRLQVNPSKLELSGRLGRTDLTAGELAILTALALAPGQTLERWQLMNILSKREEAPSAAAMEMRIARLRKKLVSVGAEPPSIKSLHKVGYTLCSAVVLV
jgi:DNA-binding response OmpR family regulator